MARNKEITLKMVKENIKKYMYLENDHIIDLILAVVISRKQTKRKLWLIVIGDSGEGKSELLKLIDDRKNTHLIKKITKSTLVTGKKFGNDLAPVLRNKVMLIPEMAQLLSLDNKEKREIMAQFRDLYDGYAGRNTSEKSCLHEDLNISFIGASTPCIDNEILIHTDLGSREFLYRAEKSNKQKLIARVLKNSQLNLDRIKEKAKQSCEEFIENTEYEDIVVSKRVQDKIVALCKLCCILRSNAKLAYNSGDLLDFVHLEKPTRITEQMLVLYKALKSLDKQYSTNKAMKIIENVCLSSGNQIRRRLLEILCKEKKEFSSRELAKELGIGKNTTTGQLNILKQLKVVHRKDIKAGEKEDNYYYKYSINARNRDIKVML